MKQLSQLATLANIAIRKNENVEEVLTLPLDAVAPKTQVRKQFTNIEELGDNIKADGQHHPIVVFPKNKAGKYVIQKGERRWRACKAAGLKTIKAIVNTAILDDLDQVAGELGENIHREDLTSFEISDALQQFIDAGWTQANIAKRINKTPVYVSLYAGLKRIPEHIRKIVSFEICNDATTLNMVAQIYEIDQKACLELCQQAQTEGALSRSMARAVLMRVKDGGTPQDAPKERPATTPHDGVVNVAGSQDSSLPGRSDDGVEPAQTKNKAQKPEKQVEEAVATKRDDSHKQPGPVTVTKEQAPEGASYQIVPTEQVKLVCSAIVLDKKWLGEVCLNRVDNEAGFLWVKLYDENGNPHKKYKPEHYVSVSASDITILEIKI